LEPQILEKETYLEGYVKDIKIKKEEVSKQQVKVNEVLIQAKGKKKEVEQLLNKINYQMDISQRRFEGIKEQVKEKLSSDTLALFAKEKPNQYKTIVPEALAYFLNGKHTSSSDKSYAFQVFEEFKIYLNEKVPKVFEGYHEELDNIEDKLGKLSETHQTLYIWGKGVIDLWEIDKILRPLKEEAAQKKEELDKLDQQLNELTQEQEAKKKELSDLEEEKNKSQAIIDDLQNQKKNQY
jgi:peptidoglycan hydrolase CwlO-like protein